MIGNLAIAGALTLLQHAGPPNPMGLTPEQQTQIALEALRNRPSGVIGLAPFVVPLALFALIAVIVWLGARQRQRRLQAQAELQKQLLDKFANGRDLSEFLETAGGRRFLDELSSQGAGPKGQVLSGIRNGLLLGVLGIGLLALSLIRSEKGMMVPAVILLALGVGFLLSAAISHHLSKQWEQDQKPGLPGGPIS